VTAVAETVVQFTVVRPTTTTTEVPTERPLLSPVAASGHEDGAAAAALVLGALSAAVVAGELGRWLRRKL
jgi:hypothetical protein